MKTKVILAAAVALIGAGCVHSEKTDLGADQPKAAPEEQKQEQAAQEAKVENAVKPKGEQSARPADTRPPAEEGRPELSSSASGLLTPDGPRLIQEALADRGYLSKDHRTGELDNETAAALRKFQADEEVARTGYPDRETVRKLGLSVAKVFKATDNSRSNPDLRR